MRKTLLLCIVLVICLAMFTSCLFDEREKDTFFSDEVLASNKLEGMPEPNLENSYLVEGDTLYLNLTDEEYAAYVEELAKFLVAKEDIYTPGYAYDWGCEVIFYITFYEYAPLEYLTEFSDTEHIFIFSTDGEVDPDSYYYSYERIGIERLSQAERLKYTTFTYNTVLYLNYSTGISGAKFVPCDDDRHYSEHVGEYVIAGSEEYCNAYVCKYCGEISTDLDLEYAMQENITYSSNANYLKLSPSVALNGSLCEIQAYKLEDVEIKLYANGVELPASAEYDDYLEYKFVMPEDDVEIDVEVLTTDPERPVINSLTDACEWLVDLDAEQVAKMTIVVGNIDAQSGELVAHYTTSEKSVIATQLSICRGAELVLASLPNIPESGTRSYTTVKIELTSGTVHEFLVKSNIFTASGRNYVISKLPNLSSYTTTEESFSFVCDGKGEIYDNYTDEKLGEADISKLEFVEYHGGIDDVVPEYRIETDFGTIYIHENDIFTLKMGGEVTAYKLTKGSLLDLIER